MIWKYVNKYVNMVFIFGDLRWLCTCDTTSLWYARPRGWLSFGYIEVPGPVAR